MSSNGPSSMVMQMRRASKVDVAAFFDVAPASVDHWIRKGCPVVERGSKGVAWVMDLHEVCKWKFGGERASGDGVDPETLPPAERKQWYEGETKRLELVERAKELIPAAEVEQAIATAFAAIVQDLRSLPDNLERRHGVDPSTAQRVEEALHQAMDSLADRLSRLAPIQALEAVEG